MYFKIRNRALDDSLQSHAALSLNSKRRKCISIFFMSISSILLIFIYMHILRIQLQCHGTSRCAASAGTQLYKEYGLPKAAANSIGI